MVRNTKMPSNGASASTFAAVDGKPVAIGRRQEAAVARVGDQALVAGRQLAFAVRRAAGTRLGILARLLLIAADDIAAARDRDLPHRQIGLAFLAWNGQRHRRAVIVQHLCALPAGPLACAEDVVDLLAPRGR